MNKIRICHIIGDFVNGGVESVLYNYFSHMDLDKFEVHIIGHGIKVQECADRFINMGFQIHNVTPKSIDLKRSLKEMKDIFKKYKFDIIHAHLTEWACVPMFLGWQCSIKVRVNHSHMAEKPQGLKNKLYYGVRLFFGKLFATDYFACGRDAGIYLFGKKAVESGKVHILPNAIDFEKFKPDAALRNKKRTELGVDDGTIVLGHVGRFFEQKNHEFLIDIFKDYHNRCPKSVLILLGDGALKQKILDKVNKYKLEGIVKFLGVRSDVEDWYQAMDVFVLPSLFEGFPVVGVEAQASGVPCLFSTAITPEIAISSSAKFLPIEDGTEPWVDEIGLSMGKETHTNIVVDRDHYDITKNANFLEQFYLNKKI